MTGKIKAKLKDKEVTIFDTIPLLFRDEVNVVDKDGDRIDINDYLEDVLKSKQLLKYLWRNTFCINTSLEDNPNFLRRKEGYNITVIGKRRKLKRK